jgi:hypothetical protein
MGFAVNVLAGVASAVFRACPPTTRARPRGVR